MGWTCIHWGFEEWEVFSMYHITFLRAREPFENPELGKVWKGCILEWRPVAGGVLQWLVLGPLLFVVYINNIDQNVQDMSIKICKLH